MSDNKKHTTHTQTPRRTGKEGDGANRNFNSILEDDAANWSKQDLVVLAAQGCEIWNDCMSRWRMKREELKKKGEDVQRIIDFSGETFRHGFVGYDFPCAVDFSKAVLHRPDFRNASFGWIAIEGEMGPGTVIDKTGPRDGRYFVSLIFYQTKFLGDLTFNVKNKEIFGVSFKDVKFNCKDQKLYCSYELLCQEVSRPYFKIYFQKCVIDDLVFKIHVNARDGVSELEFINCNLSSVGIYKYVTCRQLALRFRDNEFNASTISCEGSNVIESSSLVMFKDNGFRDSWIFICKLKMNGRLMLSSKKEMEVNAFFNKCDFDVVQFRESTFRSSFFHVTNCRISDRLEFYHVEFEYIKVSREPFVVRLSGAGYASAHAELTLKKMEVSPEGFAFKSNVISGALSIMNRCIFHGPVEFKGTVFESPFDFQDIKFKYVPDLRLMKMNNHFSMDGMEVASIETYDKSHDRKIYRDLSDKYRRLKELAITAKDHDREFEYFANEMRAKRYYERKWYKKSLNYLYEYFSDFGQSVGKPVYYLVLVWLNFGMLYALLSPAFCTLPYWDRIKYAFKLSAQNILPLMPVSRGSFQKTYEKLFGADLHVWVDALLLVEGVFGVILLFLIGLGLRNRFRL